VKERDEVAGGWWLMMVESIYYTKEAALVVY